MQAIFGKNFKGGIKLRSYCKQHSPAARKNDEVFSQDDKIDANGVKEIDMTNLADDRLQEGSEELDYFWKYVDINEVHKSVSSSYSRAKKLSLNSQVDNQDSSSSPKKGNSQGSSKKSNSSKNLFNSECAIVDKISSVSKKNSDGELDPLMLDLIYRYWVLLRTANNGQSLIKFSPSALKEKEFEQRKSIMKLRIELERVRNLSYMIGKREKLKASWLKTHHNIIKRTFSVINELNPIDTTYAPDCNSSEVVPEFNQASTAHHNNLAVAKKSYQTQLPNGMFDESDQLINDLITCDQIYEIDSPANSNYSNLPYQERCTLERRRTLSLVRRINRQFKSISNEPSINPYAKSYVAPIRSDSPVSSNPVSATVAKFFKFR